MRTHYLPFHLPDISEDEIQAVIETLRSGWLTTGPQVKQLEADFAHYVGSRYAVAVNSCTAALHLALEAAGVTAGDEVILPTMTFAATGEVVRYLQATPVLVDCREDTLNIDPSRLARAVTPRTKAIIPVHFAGHPCEMDPILAIAQDHNLTVIEDGAHALPARYQGRMVGTIGDLTCFSFYATKTITTGEGGMVTTENPEWATRMRMMSLHGISTDAWKRYSAEGSWYYEILAPGYKYNMTDIAASIGIQQLKKCDRFWQQRQRYATLYNDAFSDVREIILPPPVEGGQHAWHLYVIQLQLEQLRIDRDAVIALLKQHHIGTSVHFIPLHLHPYYRENFGYRAADFPIATAVFARTVSLPIYPKMSEDDVIYVAEVVKSIIKQHRR